MIFNRDYDFHGCFIYVKANMENYHFDPFQQSEDQTVFNMVGLMIK